MNDNSRAILVVTIYQQDGKISIYGTDGTYYGGNPGFGFGQHYNYGQMPFISAVNTVSAGGLDDIGVAFDKCTGVRYVIKQPHREEREECKRPNTMGLVSVLVGACCTLPSFDSASKYLMNRFDELVSCYYPDVMNKMMKPCWNIKDAYCRKYEQLPEYTMEELEAKLGYKFKIKSNEGDKDE